MDDEKILEIFKKHSVYRDSEAFIKDVEMYGEDENGDDLCFDENFIVEDVGSYFNDEIQNIKLDFVKEIIKEAQIELIEELNELRKDLIMMMTNYWAIDNNKEVHEQTIKFCEKYDIDLDELNISEDYDYEED